MRLREQGKELKRKRSGLASPTLIHNLGRDSSKSTHEEYFLQDDLASHSGEFQSDDKLHCVNVFLRLKEPATYF